MTPARPENQKTMAQNAQSAFVLAPGLNLQPRLAKSGPAHFSTGFLLFMSKNVQSGPAPAKLNATPRKTVHKKKCPKLALLVQNAPNGFVHPRVKPPGSVATGPKTVHETPSGLSCTLAAVNAGLIVWPDCKSNFSTGLCFSCPKMSKVVQHRPAQHRPRSPNEKNRAQNAQSWLCSSKKRAGESPTNKNCAQNAQNRQSPRAGRRRQSCCPPTPPAAQHPASRIIMADDMPAKERGNLYEFC